jgi:hypothetical protein
MEDSKFFVFIHASSTRGRINDLLDISLGRPRRDSQKNLSSLENDLAKLLAAAGLVEIHRRISHHWKMIVPNFTAALIEIRRRISHHW